MLSFFVASTWKSAHRVHIILVRLGSVFHENTEPSNTEPSQENTELTKPSWLGILTEPSQASRNIYIDFDFKN